MQIKQQLDSWTNLQKGLKLRMIDYKKIQIIKKKEIHIPNKNTNILECYLLSHLCRKTHMYNIIK